MHVCSRAVCGEGKKRKQVGNRGYEKNGELFGWEGRGLGYAYNAYEGASNVGGVGTWRGSIITEIRVEREIRGAHCHASASW